MFLIGGYANELVFGNISGVNDSTLYDHWPRRRHSYDSEMKKTEVVLHIT